MEIEISLYYRKISDAAWKISLKNAVLGMRTQTEPCLPRQSYLNSLEMFESQIF